MTEQTNNLLIIDNLSLWIKNEPVLKNINLNIEKGEIVLLCGKSGSGKSALASVLSGYYKNMSANVDFDRLTIANEDIENFKTYNRYQHLVVSFQNARLSLCTQNLREELIFVLENLKTPRERIEKLAINQANKHGLLDLLDQKFDSLSGGQLQKVAFCAIDMIDSQLYVLDEPFANIDDDSTSELQKIIRKRLNEGSSYLIIDHRLELWDFVDRVVILGSDGEIIDNNIKLQNQCDDMKKIFIENGLMIDGENIKIKNINHTDDFIQADNINLSYKSNNKINQIIKNASFSFPEKKLIALTGDSGAGKSTIFKVLLKQISYGGSIKIWGKELKNFRRKELLKKIGLVFQDPTLQFVTTNVLMELTGERDYENVSQVTKELLKSYRLDRYIEKSPWMLSQGEQRRLAVITMLTLNKDLLLVDEPTYGQDLKNASLIMDDLKRLSKDITIIFTSHDKNLVKLYADLEYKITDKKVIKIAW